MGGFPVPGAVPTVLSSKRKSAQKKLAKVLEREQLQAEAAGAILNYPRHRLPDLHRGWGLAKATDCSVARVEPAHLVEHIDYAMRGEWALLHARYVAAESTFVDPRPRTNQAAAGQSRTVEEERRGKHDSERRRLE